MDIEQYATSFQSWSMLKQRSRFRKAGYQAIDRICDYYYSLQNLPVISKVEPGYLKEHIPCEFVDYRAIPAIIVEFDHVSSDRS